MKNKLYRYTFSRVSINTQKKRKDNNQNHNRNQFPHVCFNDDVMKMFMLFSVIHILLLLLIINCRNPASLVILP